MTLYQSRRLRHGRHSAANQIYLVTTNIAERQPLLENFQAARTVIRGMRRLDTEMRVDSMAFVIMPDHLHWLFSLHPGNQLSDVMRLLKGRASRELNMRRLANGTIWQSSFHDHALRREENIQDVARYIIANPVRAGLVKSVREYPHWDAVWL